MADNKVTKCWKPGPERVWAEMASYIISDCKKRKSPDGIVGAVLKPN